MGARSTKRFQVEPDIPDDEERCRYVFVELENKRCANRKIPGQPYCRKCSGQYY